MWYIYLWRVVFKMLSEEKVDEIFVWKFGVKKGIVKKKSS